MEDLLKLELNEGSIKHLQSIRRWTLFFSILGFITIGLILLIAIFSKTIVTGINPESSFVIVYLILAVIYFFPIYYLYKFSVLSKAALNSLNSFTLQESLKFLKPHIRFIGVLTIILLAIYLVIAFGILLKMAF